MCETARVNRKWGVVSIAGGGLLVVATAAAAGMGVSPSSAPVLGLEVLWGGWLAYNVLWCGLDFVHLISLPDVCPCDPPQPAEATAVKRSWARAVIVAVAIACYSLALAQIHP